MSVHVETLIGHGYAREDAELLFGLRDEGMLALTMMGEARGDSAEGDSSVEERIAVGWSIRNRFEAKPDRFQRYIDVCLAPAQFSCWLIGDPNMVALLQMAELLHQEPNRPVAPLLAETLYLARGILDEWIQDRTRGATHFYHPRSMKPATRVPSWATGLTPSVQVGSGLFFAGVRW